MTKLSRREFLKSAALAAAGALVTGFKKAPTESDEPESFLAPLADACNVQFQVHYGHCKPPPLIIYGHFDSRSPEHPDIRFVDTERNVWTVNHLDFADIRMNGMPIVLDRQITMIWPPPDVMERQIAEDEGRSQFRRVITIPANAALSDPPPNAWPKTTIHGMDGYWAKIRVDDIPDADEKKIIKMRIGKELVRINAQSSTR